MRIFGKKMYKYWMSFTLHRFIFYPGNLDGSPGFSCFENGFFMRDSGPAPGNPRAGNGI